MEKIPLSYYPPRARFTSGLYYLWMGCRQFLGQGRASWPDRFTGRAFLWSLLCPGYAFMTLGWKRVGWTIFIAYGCAVLVAMAAIGQGLAAFAFGMILSIHTTSILQCLAGWSPFQSLGMRLLATLGVLAILYVVIYAPAAGWFMRHVALPIQTRNGILIVRPDLSPGNVQTGQLVAYQLPYQRGPNYIFQNGLGLDAVLARPGDKVVFDPEHYSVNGQPRSRFPTMPGNGTMIIPENHWFIWPQLRIVNGRNQNHVNVTPIILQAALVPHENLKGRPYRRWFGRRQRQP